MSSMIQPAHQQSLDTSMAKGAEAAPITPASASPVNVLTHGQASNMRHTNSGSGEDGLHELLDDLSGSEEECMENAAHPHSLWGSYW